jgi:hypothetical protein
MFQIAVCRKDLEGGYSNSTGADSSVVYSPLDEIRENLRITRPVASRQNASTVRSFRQCHHGTGVTKLIIPSNPSSAQEESARSVNEARNRPSNVPAVIPIRKSCNDENIR